MQKCNSDFAELAIDIGESLLLNGAEIQRVEDTVSRICSSFGAIKTEAFCIIKAMVVTVRFSDGSSYTASRRITATSNNYKRIAHLNSLSRSVCSGELTLDEARARLNDINSGYECKFRKTLAGYTLLALSCCIFFGGNYIDALMTIPCALFMSVYSNVIGKIGINKTVYNFIASFICGVIIMLTSLIGIDINIGHVITGALMMLIPGIALSSSIEDLLLGDTTSGMLNICESVLSACAIALGYALAVKLFGVTDIYNEVLPHSWAILILMSLISAFAYATVGNASTTLFLFTSLGGLISYAVFLPVFDITQNEFGSIFIAASVATVYSRICARLLKCPTPIFSTPAMIPLAPGNVLYLTIHHALMKDWGNMQHYFIRTLIISSGIALGLMSVMFLWNLISGLIRNAGAMLKNK